MLYWKTWKVLDFECECNVCTDADTVTVTTRRLSSTSSTDVMGKMMANRSFSKDDNSVLLPLPHPAFCFFVRTRSQIRTHDEHRLRSA